MISAQVRREKALVMARLSLFACKAWESGKYDQAAASASKLWGFTLAFSGVDSDIFWYGSYLHRIYGEFITSDCQDFTAWVLFKACQAFNGSSEPMECVA